MEETIFTKIITGEIPSHKIYEDEDTLAFLDIHPDNEGHTLVIPKKHVEFVWDLDDATYQALMATSKKVALQLREVLPYTYVHQRIVGTDVPHAHVHLVPFNTVSQTFTPEGLSKEANQADLAALAERLKFT
jgi:histidine triad (HIT) family protein